MNQQILIVEIRIANQTDFDLNQTSPMTIYRDPSNYHLAIGMETIKAAIFNAIPHFGSNYRHPLIFNVQVIPGNKVDAIVASASQYRANRRRRSNN